MATHVQFLQNAIPGFNSEMFMSASHWMMQWRVQSQKLQAGTPSCSRQSIAPEEHQDQEACACCSVGRVPRDWIETDAKKIMQEAHLVETVSGCDVQAVVVKGSG